MAPTTQAAEKYMQSVEHGTQHPAGAQESYHAKTGHTVVRQPHGTGVRSPGVSPTPSDHHESFSFTKASLHHPMGKGARALDPALGPGQRA